MIEYNIPEELLTRYVSVIKSIQAVLKAHRFAESSSKIVDAFSILEKERQTIHDEILKTANVKRNDSKFSFYLATLVEELLYESN